MANNLSATLHKWARKRGNEVAFVIDGVELSWASFDVLTARAAASIGMRTDAQASKIALQVRSPADFLVIFFATLRLGQTVVPLAPDLAGLTRTQILRTGRVSLLIQENADDDVQSDGVPRALVNEIINGPDTSAYAFDALNVDPARDMTVFFSSGTTNSPKGIVHTYQARELSARRLALYYDVSRSLVTAPIHCPPALSPILGAVFAGGQSIISKFHPETLSATVAQYQASCLSLTPTQYQTLLEAKNFVQESLRRVHHLNCAGAPLSPSLRDELYAIFPDNFVHGYGSTEFDLISRTPRGALPDKRGSVGPPAADVDVVVLDESDRPLAAGDVGEIALFSRGMMRCYLGEQTSPEAQWWRSSSGCAYLRTGDLGRVDESGYIWLVDRKKDVIITAGCKVLPSDIEAVLRQNPAVSDAVVLGVPSRVLGETPVAIVTLNSGAQTLAAAADLCRWTNARLHATQRLYAVYIAASLPRNAGGKLLRNEVRRRVLSGEFSMAASEMNDHLQLDGHVAR